MRINAEDPFKDFRPAPGRIQQYLPPGGVNVRMDSHLYTEYVVPPNYDSLLGKLIVWGKDRGEAIARMRRCINETVIVGACTVQVASFGGCLWLHEGWFVALLLVFGLAAAADVSPSAGSPLFAVPPQRNLIWCQCHNCYCRHAVHTELYSAPYSVIAHCVCALSRAQASFGTHVCIRIM